MIIGIPRESYRDERRVGLTPAGVHTLATAGHAILIQSDAGSGSGFSRQDYEEAGANIVFSSNEIFSRADLVVKVMPPTVEEASWLQDDRILFSIVQLGVANPEVHRLLGKHKTTAVGYEMIEDSIGNLPVLTAMSEIAGKLLPQIAGRYLETTYGGRGVCLSGLPGISASNIVIIGAGTVGKLAACSFLGAGASVMILDSDLYRLRNIQNALPRPVNTALATQYNVSRAVEFADVLVGAVLIRGKRSPHVITEAMVKKMKAGTVIIDVSIDQGGCVETSHPTTLSDPIFVKHGVIHYCVPNIASSVARTASHAFNNVLLPFVQAVAEKGFSAFAENLELRRGLYMYHGESVNAELAFMLDADTEQKRGVNESW
jgi:alanine dehydrogenase